MSKTKLNVNEIEIVLFKQNKEEFIGLWEKLNNPNFKGIEFDGFKNEKCQINVYI